MVKIVEVDDINIPELEVFTRLTEAQLKSEANREKGIFIAESPNVIHTALDKGYKPISLLMEKKRIETQGKSIIERLSDITVYTAADDILKAIVGYPLTRGILCAMERPEMKTPLEVIENAKIVAVLEDIVDSTNIGAIFRSAAALGIDGIILSPSCADPFNRRSVRVSMGTVFQIPFSYISEEADFWPEGGLRLLSENGFTTLSMALCDNTVSISDESLKQKEKIAIILGTEGTGLRKETIEKSDITVKIPMQNGVDSLNVGNAAAIAFWELAKRNQF